MQVYSYFCAVKRCISLTFIVCALVTLQYVYSDGSLYLSNIISSAQDSGDSGALLSDAQLADVSDDNFLSDVLGQ